MNNEILNESDLIDSILRTVTEQRFEAIEIARKNCVEQTDGYSCAGYHGIRFLLKHLGVNDVYEIQHEVFYKYMKSLCARRKPLNSSPRLLVCGAADFIVPSMVSLAFSEMGLDARITVMDRCRTPLELCERFSSQFNFSWEYIQDDILNHESDVHYDFICTDRFLGFFQEQACQTLIRKWMSLLDKDGKIITTIQIRPNGPRSQAELDNRMDKFRMVLINSEENPAYDTNDLCDMVGKCYFPRQNFLDRGALVEIFKSGGLVIDSFEKIPIPARVREGRDNFELLAIIAGFPNYPGVN